MTTLKAEKRSMDVKAKRLRREGYVTGNVFGKKIQGSIPVKMEKKGVDRLLNPNYAKGDAPAAILTREGAGPFMQVLRGADKLAGAVRSALTLGTFAGLLGMLIVFYLLYQNAADALPVMNILLYQLIWYIPVFIITQQTR